MNRAEAKKAALECCIRMQPSFTRFVFPAILQSEQRDIIRQLLDVQPLAEPTAEVFYAEYQNERTMYYIDF